MANVLSSTITHRSLLLYDTHSIIYSISLTLVVKTVALSCGKMRRVATARHLLKQISVWLAQAVRFAWHWLQKTR